MAPSSSRIVDKNNGRLGFLSLPAEIRVMIYKELLLESPRGVHIKHQPGRYRRQIFHCHPAFCLRDCSMEWELQQNSTARSRLPSMEGLTSYILRQKLLGQDVAFAADETGIQNLQRTKDLHRQQRVEQGARHDNIIWPAILATNSLVYAEGVYILYNQVFSFCDTNALLVFLAALGPPPLATIRDVTILGWADKRPLASEAVPAFALLNQVTNLRRLHLSCSLGRSQDWAWSNVFPPRYNERENANNNRRTARGAYRQPADLVAHKVYRDCWSWLAPLFARTGMDGVRRVLRVNKKNLLPLFRSSPKPMPAFTPAMEATIHARFWACLEVLLQGNVA